MLATPKSLNLDAIKNTSELKNKENILKSTILFEFGTQHKKRIQDWFEKNRRSESNLLIQDLMKLHYLWSRQD